MRKKLKPLEAEISEVFKSIQGEGPYCGKDQIFVRFFGCNLKCRFCDTTPNFFSRKSVYGLLDEICRHSDYHAVSLTGGEPLLQLNFLKELAYHLKKKDIKVYLETNGILYDNLLEVIDSVDIISMDFKLASSTGMKSFWQEHEAFLKVAKQKEVFIKAVIGPETTQEDILRAAQIIMSVAADKLFIMQPQNPYEDAVAEKLERFSSICMQEGLKFDIIPQIHKISGVK